MAKTCEELVIQELESLRENQAGLLNIIDELKKENEKLKNQPETEFTPHEVKAYEICEPVDVVMLSVKNDWDMSRSDSDFEEMGIAEIRALMDTEEGLRELGNKKTGAWREKYLSLNFKTFPYTIKYGRNAFAIDFYNNGGSVSCYKIFGKSQNMRTGDYFTADCTDDLEAHGYELFKKNIEKYLAKREERERDGNE